jgi:hypothetical protein
VAKVKRARLHRRGGNNAVVDDNDQFPRAEGRALNVQGTTDGNASVRVHVSVFYRVNGFPFRKVLVQNSATVNSVANQFTIQVPNDFKPEYRVLHSLRVLAWDTGAAVTPTAAAKRHVVRVRVKSK